MGLAHVRDVTGASSASGQASFTSTAASFTAGNLLIAIITWSTSTASPTSISTPSGWTQAGFIKNGAPNGASAVYTYANNPGGSQSWTWTETGGNALGWSYTIMEWSGAPTGTVIDLTVTDTATGSTSSTTHDPGAATGTTQAGDAIIGLLGLNRSTPPTASVASTSNPTSGWTLTTASNSTGGTVNAGTVCAYQIVAGTVTSPDCIFTTSSTSSGEVFLLTILAASGGTVSSGVVDLGTNGGGLSAAGTSIIASGLVNIGNQNPSDAAFPDLPLGSNKGGLAVPDLPMGGKGAMSLPDLPLGNAGGGVVPTGNTLKPVSLFTIGDNGAGLIGTALLIVPSGIIDMGDNGAGLIATGYTQTVLGDLGAGLLATGTAIIPSGQITMGGQGDLVATGIIPIQSGVVLLGTNGDGIVPSGTAVSYSGVVNTGSQGAGLVETVLVLVSPTQFSVGNNGGGITPFFAPLTIRSGQVLMGGGGGIQVTASMTISVGVVMGNSPHSGLPPISGSIGFPGGHWQYFTLWMWRASQGPGWKLVRLHRWKNGAWKNI